MKQAPLSLNEAIAICADYQYLIGQSFGPGRPDAISCIVISPYDQMCKKRFLAYYNIFGDAEMALSHDYKGMLYDVLVISSSADGLDMQHEDLCSWLAKNKPVFTYATGVQSHAAQQMPL